MKEKMDLLLNEIKEKLEKVNNLKDLNELKINYLSKKGPISAFSNHIKELSNDERKDFGMLLNNLKNSAQKLFNDLEEKINNEILNRKLEKEKIEYETIKWSKEALIIKCTKRKIKIISSMGTGNKLNPTLLEICDIRKTSYDPIAKILIKKIIKISLDNCNK